VIVRAPKYDLEAVGVLDNVYKQADDELELQQPVSEKPYLFHKAECHTAFCLAYRVPGKALNATSGR